MEYWLVWASMDYPASWFAQYQRFKIISKILKEWLPMTKNLIKFSWFYWWNFSQLWIPGLDFHIYQLWLLLACGNVWDRFNPLSHCIRGKVMLSLGKSWWNASAPPLRPYFILWPVRLRCATGAAPWSWLTSSSFHLNSSSSADPPPSQFW